MHLSKCLTALAVAAFLGGANAAFAQQLGVGTQPHSRGRYVNYVIPGSLASDLGVLQGDVIFRISGYSIRYPGDITRAMNAVDANGDAARVMVWRHNGSYWDTELLEGGGPIEEDVLEYRAGSRHRKYTRHATHRRKVYLHSRSTRPRR